MLHEKLSSNLRLLMRELGLSSNELARQIDIPASSIKRILNIENSNPTLATLLPIAKHFSITIGQLIGEDLLQQKCTGVADRLNVTKVKMIPIVSWNKISIPSEIKNENTNFIATERSLSDDAFALIIEEEIAGRFSKGTILLIEPHASPQNNDIILVKKSNQQNFSLKLAMFEDGEMFLKSISIGDHIIRKNNEHQILGVIMENRKYLK